MKLKVTQREVRDQLKYGGNVFQIGYCDLQRTLRGKSAIAYNCGVYGWNWDLYKLETMDGLTVYITTGYHGMIGRPVKYELIKQFENEARDIWENRETTYQTKELQGNQLVDKLVHTLLGKGL